MDYSWKKEKDKYKYSTSQFTGDFKCESTEKIDPKILDLLFFQLQARGNSEGETEFKGQTISYKFKAKDLWEEEEEEEPEKIL